MGKVNNLWGSGAATGSPFFQNNPSAVDRKTVIAVFRAMLLYRQQCWCWNSDVTIWIDRHVTCGAWHLHSPYEWLINVSHVIQTCRKANNSAMIAQLCVVIVCSLSSLISGCVDLLLTVAFIRCGEAGFHPGSLFQREREREIRDYSPACVSQSRSQSIRGQHARLI